MAVLPLLLHACLPLALGLASALPFPASTSLSHPLASGAPRWGQMLSRQRGLPERSRTQVHGQQEEEYADTVRKELQAESKNSSMQERLHAARQQEA